LRDDASRPIMQAYAEHGMKDKNGVPKPEALVIKGAWIYLMWGMKNNETHRSIP
jgi:hypothetical protein